MSDLEIRLAGPDDGAVVASLRIAWGLELGAEPGGEFGDVFDVWWERERERRLT